MIFGKNSGLSGTPNLIRYRFIASAVWSILWKDAWKMDEETYAETKKKEEANES